MQQDRISEVLLDTMTHDSSWDVRATAASVLNSLLGKLSNAKRKEVEDNLAYFRRAQEIHQQELRNHDDGC